MSFPTASIAVVNSILSGVYSNTLLALTATSHQDRRAQPPSCMHVFIAGCTGGFLQVRGRCGGTYTQVHMHTRVHTHTQGWSVPSFPFSSLCTHSADPRLSRGEHKLLWGNGQLLAAPFQAADPGGGSWGTELANGRESRGRGAEMVARGHHAEAADAPPRG